MIKSLMNRSWQSLNQNQRMKPLRKSMELKRQNLEKHLKNIKN